MSLDTSPPGHRERRRRRHTRRPPDGFELLVTGGIGAVCLVFLAFNEGGLDPVLRQQAALALCWTAALGYIFGVLPRARVAREGRLVLTGLAALVALTALSLLWTESAERTYSELTRIVGYGAVAAVALVGISRTTWRAAAWGICIAALVVPICAVATRVTPDLLPGDALSGFERLSYPLGYWNALAAWSAMAVAIGLALSSHLRNPGRRVAALATVPIAGLCVYLTLSRGGILACALAVMLVCLLGRNRVTVLVHALAAIVATAGLILLARSRPAIVDGGGPDDPVFLGVLALAALFCAAVALWTRQAGADRIRRLRGRPGRALAIGMALAAVTAGIVGGTDLVAGARDEFQSESYPTQGGDPAARLTSLGGERGAVWGSALDAFTSAPLGGIGPGTFEFWWSMDVADGEDVRDAHSLYLEQLAELGLPGFCLLLVALGALAYGSVRRCTRAGDGTPVALATGLTAAFGTFLFHAGVDWLWESTAVTVLALLCGCCAVAAGSERYHGSARKRWRTRKLAYAGAAVLAGALMIPGVVALERIRASYSALVVGQSEEAERIADEAIAAEPWAASPYAVRSLARIERGLVAEARQDARAAIKRETTNWRHQALLAAIEVRAGEEQAVEDALQRARGLNPGLDLTPSDLGLSAPLDDASGPQPGL